MKSRGSTCISFYDRIGCATDREAVVHPPKQILSAVRTEHMSGHLLSVRLSDKPARRGDRQVSSGRQVTYTMLRYAILCLLDTVLTTVALGILKLLSWIDHTSD